MHGVVHGLGKNGGIEVKDTTGAVREVPKADLRMPKGGFRQRDNSKAAEEGEQRLPFAVNAFNPDQPRDKDGKWTVTESEMAEAAHPVNALTDGAYKKLNQAGIDAANRRFKPSSIGTLADVLKPHILEHVPKEVHDTPIELRRVDGGNATDGKTIFWNPDQPTADYVPGLLHEASHVLDAMGVSGGKFKPFKEPLDRADKKAYAKYKRQPQEMRAERFARGVIERTAIQGKSRS